MNLRNNFWTKLDRPIKILAPMAGYTDAAFRLLCREFGADVVFTELISADAIAYSKELRIENCELRIDKEKYTFRKVISKKNQPTADLLSFFEAERPIVVQLFGKNPENFAIAAKWVSQNLKPDGIDINMGCPAKKVVNSGHGSALMKNPALATEIVKAVKSATDLPVSVKTRLGWASGEEILEFAPELVAAGIDAIMIHGRTYKDGFKGAARWENIFKVKKIFGDKLIVIGNGDLKAGSKVSGVWNEPPNTKSLTPNLLDGFAIGRAAFGAPWIFSEQKAESLKLKAEQELGALELKNVILRHAKLAFGTKGEFGLIEFRKHILAYLRGFAGAKELRTEAVRIQSLEDIEAILAKLPD